MRRLFSSFARGWPGAGLLLLRLVAGVALLNQAIDQILAGHSVEAAMFAVIETAAGILLLAGLWTPIAGGLAALLELRNAVWHTDNLWVCVLVGALCAALAMIGPGAWSIDARRFGWKRIDKEL